jgi:uncharacterized protein (TIGR02646 family)
MRKFTSGSAPDFLKDKWEAWGERYKNNREKNPAFTFQWPTHDGQTINVLIEPFLKKQTDDHCSFCDNFPIRTKEDSIDHFKPKSVPAYYELVCQWENLYYSCHNCQQHKLEQYDELLLRPDDLQFSFETYFIYSFSSHKIDPNPKLEEKALRQAETTIRIFGLNDEGHIAARRISLERYEAKRTLGEDIEVDDFPYRFTII